MGPFYEKIYGKQNRNESSWYGEEGWFLYYSFPWFLRGGGGAGGTGSGIFRFSSSSGTTSFDTSFRLVLAI